jgi:hypothetical protein
VFEKLIAFLMREPLILVVVGAWLVGMLGGIVKAVKQARARAERARQLPRESEASTLPPLAQQRPEPLASPSPSPSPAPVATPPAERSPEALAREMRRILGIEEPPAEATRGNRAEPPEPASAGGPLAEAAPPSLPSATVRKRNAVEPERAPVPVVPTTNRRRLDIHVDPHVGEGIERRTAPQSGRVGSHAAGSELGSLGGRSPAQSRQRTTRSRFPLTDLKRILVLNEILGPPLALRRDERGV